MSLEEIVAQTDLIKRLHVSGVRTGEIHKAVERPGKRLGDAGKQAVRGRIFAEYFYMRCWRDRD